MPKVKPGFLASTVARVKREVAARRAAIPETEWIRRARETGPARPWAAAIAGPDGVRVIAEIKRRSPSAGPLAPGVDAAQRARLYVEHGAAAISVLTDSAFDGRPADLEAVAGAVQVPVLRKDFLVEPYQVWESRALGADAVLVIVGAVGDRTLGALIETAGTAGLGLLVEIHTPGEADRALAAGATVLGVNARHLATLEVESGAALEVLADLRGRVGADGVLVAESAIRSDEDVRAARAAGADAVLVGERLMRARDPGGVLAMLVQAGTERP
ncbi:MAG TPA: indole-3-glycerol phosphate synthase TrpC [Gemmatimonadota bacterium]|nr:indole-3-glycerol phosphate synthase TrpC [Gemmatimonadota bacterium]